MRFCSCDWGVGWNAPTVLVVVLVVGWILFLLYRLWRDRPARLARETGGLKNRAVLAGFPWTPGDLLDRAKRLGEIREANFAGEYLDGLRGTLESSRSSEREPEK